MILHNVTDTSFLPYGKVLKGYDLAPIMKAMESTPLPEDDVIYVPSVKELEALEIAEQLRKKAYGELPIQVGYCNGNNKRLNAVEYHRSSEVDIAVNDLILLLGRQQDIEEDYTYDTSKIEAFLVPAGTAVELYATTLHYAPCTGTDKGFRCVIVLPEGTNEELTDFHQDEEDKLISAKNKWLIAHEDAGIQGAFCGLKGENITIERKRKEGRRL